MHNTKNMSHTKTRQKMLNRDNFVSNFEHEHDVMFFTLDTNTTRTQIRISVSPQFRFVSCIFVVSCHKLTPLPLFIYLYIFSLVLPTNYNSNVIFNTYNILLYIKLY